MREPQFVRPRASAAQSQRESRALRSSCRRAWLFGRPLPTADAWHEAVGLAFEPGIVISSVPYRVAQEGE